LFGPLTGFLFHICFIGCERRGGLEERWQNPRSESALLDNAVSNSKFSSGQIGGEIRYYSYVSNSLFTSKDCISISPIRKRSVVNNDVSCRSLSKTRTRYAARSIKSATDDANSSSKPSARHAAASVELSARKQWSATKIYVQNNNW
jgi:hypothetical protein